MKDFFALVSLDDFDKLFKYGRLQLVQGHTVLVPVPFEQVREMPSLFNLLVNGICDFQLSFEYVILHYQKKPLDLNFILFIDEVKGLYPLNEEAKRRIAPRLDSRVYINDPIWPNQMQKLIDDRRFEASIRGIDNVWNIFGLKNKKDYNKCSKVVDNEIIKAMLDYAYSGTPLSGKPLDERSIWLYLMRYRRYSMFPTTTSAFILDAAYIVYMYENDGDEDDVSLIIDQSPLCQDMFKQEEVSLTNILDYVEQTHPVFVNHTDGIAKDYYVAAPIFCMLIDTVGDNVLDLDASVCGTTLRNVINELLEKYPFAVKLSLYMFGAVMGYEKTYDELYQKEKLALFKKDEVTPFHERSNRGKATPNRTSVEKSTYEEATLDFNDSKYDEENVVNSKLNN